jgi:hypothetical protein
MKSIWARIKSGKFLKFKNGFKELANRIKQWKIASIIGAILGYIIWRFAMIGGIFVAITIIGDLFMHSDIMWIEIVSRIFMSSVLFFLTSFSEWIVLGLTIVGGIIAITDIMHYNEMLKEEEMQKQGV